MRYLDDGTVLVEFVDAGNNLQRVTLTPEAAKRLAEELQQEKPPVPAPEPTAEQAVLAEEAAEDAQHEDDEPQH